MVYVLTFCEQDQDVLSWSCSQTVSKPVWHIPLRCVQCKTPEDGQRNCPKHVEFYSKNKFEKLVHLVRFIIRSWFFFTLSPCFSQNHFKTNYFQPNSVDRKKYRNLYHHQYEQGIRSYVYWTVHHLDSWIKRDQLDVTCFCISLFNAQHVPDVIHPSSGACDLCVELFHGLYCSGTMCVGVTVSFGWGGVVWYPYAGWSLHKDTTPPQPNHTVTPTHIEPEQYNPWNNSKNNSQAPEDGYTNIRNMLSIK
jgi:hypothetical protein